MSERVDEKDTRQGDVSSVCRTLAAGQAEPGTSQTSSSQVSSPTPEDAERRLSTASTAGEKNGAAPEASSSDDKLNNVAQPSEPKRLQGMRLVLVEFW